MDFRLKLSLHKKVSPLKACTKLEKSYVGGISLEDTKLKINGIKTKNLAKLYYTNDIELLQDHL